MTRMRMGWLLLGCLAIAGCGVFGPKSTQHRARVLTRQPDPNVACDDAHER